MIKPDSYNWTELARNIPLKVTYGVLKNSFYIHIRNKALHISLA